MPARKTPPKKRDRGPRIPEGMKILQVFLDEDTHRQFKAYSVLKGRGMSEIVVGIVSEILQKERVELRQVRKEKP